MLLGLGVVFIVGLIIMALKPEFVIPGIILLTVLALWIGIVYLGSVPGKKLITGKMVTVGIIMLLVGAVFAGLIFANPDWVKFDIGAPGDYQTNTKELELGGLRGMGTFTDGIEKDEMFDDNIYVSAWTGTEESEKIVIQGKAKKTGITYSAFSDAEYRIRMASGDTWGDPIKKDVSWTVNVWDTFIFDTEIFRFTDSFEGWIKVELWVNFVGLAGGWGRLAYDCARVENGKGNIDFVKGIYEVGEYAELELDLGYAKGQYHLQVKALTTGEMLFEGFIDEEDEGRVTRMTFLVKASHVGIGTWPDCPDNLIEAKLWNELFEKAQHETAVTDIKTLGPQKPTIELSSPKDGKAYRTGEIISITIKGKPNLQTQAPIKEYRLHISPGDIVEENTGGTFTFQPAHRGTFKLMYSCQDAVCRRSEVVTKEIHVYDEGEDPPVIEGDFPWSIILILLAGLIGFLITVLVMKDKGVGTVKSLLVGAVVLVIIFLSALWFTGGLAIWPCPGGYCT